MRKNYVLDANILIHDPDSIFHFADNTVIIPVGVISEIDRFKKEMTDRGYNARAIVRRLDALRGSHSLSQGVDLPNGGRLRVHCDPDQALSPATVHGDIEVLRVAQAVRNTEPCVPVVIVTKDINLRIRADAAGMRAEDYESDHVSLSDLYTGQFEWDISPEKLDAFRGNGALALNGQARSPNEYALLRSTGASHASALGRVNASADCVVALKEPEKGLWGLKPRNKEQYFAIDALLDDDLQLVTLMGKAGTGKTLLAVAAAMHLSIRRKKYRGVLVARPIVPLGRDIGYLPGDVERKLEPWMKPIVDTIEFLLDSGGPIKGYTDCEALLRSGAIEIQPLTYIRGRSISNRIVIIDEAQNLTPLEVKTVITRIGADARVILTGDPYQINNPYVDASSSGFTSLVNRFRSQKLAAHIELKKGERSPLAELAANLL